MTPCHSCGRAKGGRGERTGRQCWLQMNRLSLRNDRSKFETAGMLLIVVEEFTEYAPI